MSRAPVLVLIFSIVLACNPSTINYLELDKNQAMESSQNVTNQYQNVFYEYFQFPSSKDYTASTSDGQIMILTVDGFINGLTYYPPGLHLLNYPDTGSDVVLGASQMVISKSYSLPSNLTDFEECSVTGDGAVFVLHCLGVDLENIRVDFSNGESINANGYTNLVVSWNDTGSILGHFQLNRTANPNPCGADVMVHKIINSSLLVEFDSVYSSQENGCNVIPLGNGSNVSCSGYESYHTCDFILLLDWNGTVLDGIKDDTGSIGRLRINEHSFQWKSSCAPCNFRLLNDTVLFSSNENTQFTHGFTFDFEHIRSVRVNPCPSGSGISIQEVVIDENYTFYVATGNYFHTACSTSNSNPPYHSTVVEWMGEQVNNLSTGEAQSYYMTIGFKDAKNQNNSWSKFFKIDAACIGYHSKKLLTSFDDKFIFGGGKNCGPVINWPNPIGEQIFNQAINWGQYGLIFDMNGTLYAKTPSCHFSDWHRTVLSNSIDTYSCNKWSYDSGSSTYQSSFYQNSIDRDFDGIGDKLDAFPSDATQKMDSDVDGYGDNPFGNHPDSCPTSFGESTIDKLGCLDTDSDGWSDDGDAFRFDNTQHNDSDQDGFGDNLSGFQGDDCPSEFGTSSRNNTYGCPDGDYDGWADFQDAFENDSSQWKDSDGDGYGDQIDGFTGDECVDTPGTSYIDRFGCPDADEDGVSDKNDAFPNNPSQTDDRDGDGYGDNQSESATQVDYFPSDTTQWNDTDADGYGDNQNGNLPDRFPNDPTRWSDSDHDGVADEDDEFPDDGTQFADTDGDGYGDVPNGNRADAFPNDPEEWLDTDGDGLGNNADAFPFDPTQTEDRDGDGMGDNPMGIGADKFPDDITQWGDIDGDGYGDNPNGTSPDAFPTDATQWSDVDGDGYGDNPTGRLPDAFPNDPTQWEDLDGDGLGDNLTGNNADLYLFDFDNDGYNDSIDPLPKLASPGDLDNDGVLDEDDLFPEDYREWADFDGDGEGDNADTDDDNDGWTDTDEARQGTDPFSSASQPVDSFEIVIPGTAIGLGAWDLIGIFGGVPLFAWIGFGFATRNARTARYEEMLRSAQSIEDLEQVSHMWEYSLMMRMLGPHQGIRLERLRADLEYEFSGQRRTSIVHESADQTELVSKEVPALQTAAPVASLPPTQITEDGYEWLDYDGQKYYRLTGSATDWTKFE